MSVCYAIFNGFGLYASFLAVQGCTKMHTVIFSNKKYMDSVYNNW